MRSGNSFLNSLLMSSVVVLAMAAGGCSVHAGYRTYDPYYHDYHTWDDHERVYYNQWTVETHHDNRDFRKLNKDEQKQYWDWRHSHGDHDHDNEHH